MSQIIPVPPNQIIEKLDISATEKQAWLQYIENQQNQEAEMLDHQMEMEMEKTDREFTLKEQETQLDFLVDMAKIQQMAEKDEKAMATKLEQMDSTERGSVMQFAAQMFQIASAAEQNAKGGDNGERKQTSA
jgi:hypothetical protein